jgi:hypothetical protein
MPTFRPSRATRALRRLGGDDDARIDALAAKIGELSSRVEALEPQMAQITTNLDEITKNVGWLMSVIEDMRGPVSLLPQIAQDTAAIPTDSALLRSLVDEEPATRRRLQKARTGASYQDAFDHRNALVSVTIATVGRVEELMKRSLPAILGQTHPNIEVVLVGDAAPEELGEAVASLGDPRVRYSNLTQRLVAHDDPRRHWLVGGALARNQATAQATGQWLLQADDDDELRPDAVRGLLELAQERRVEVAYGCVEEHHPDGSTKVRRGFPPGPETFALPAALIHSDLRFFERELSPADRNIAGDRHLLARMLRAGVSFAMLDEIVIDYFPSTVWETEQPPAASS